MSAIDTPIWLMDTNRTPNPFELHLLAAVLSDELRSARRNSEWAELARNGATLEVDRRGVAHLVQADNFPTQ